MRGLDPRIHQSSQGSFEVMDCRVKPGNDGNGLLRFARNDGAALCAGPLARNDGRRLTHR
jgi:hypothetical protein